MELEKDLTARGLVEHTSADLSVILGTNRTVYLGVDPSADSMHAGHLMVVLTMRRLAQAEAQCIDVTGKSLLELKQI